MRLRSDIVAEKYYTWANLDNLARAVQQPAPKSQ
jgi:hypothetical protein